jgi:iron complex transport system ATP-binding protein
MTSLELDRVMLQVGARRLLDDVSLRVTDSDFVVVVGPNGAGKTTLLRAALGLIGVSSGRVLLDGMPLSSFSGRERAARVGWLPQRGVVLEPISALEFVAAARYRFRESRAQMLRAARQALELARAAAVEVCRVTELSGGELQRVLIASLLAQESPLLLLDEPANYLDPAQQIEIYSMLSRLWRSHFGVLCVTHDINAIASAIQSNQASCVRVVGLKGGRVEFATTYDAPDLGDRLARLFDTRMRTIGVEDRRLFIAEPLDAEPLA